MFPEADEVLCAGDLVQFEVTVVSNLPDPDPGNNSVEIKWKVIINDQEILLDDPNYTNKASITYPYDIPMTVAGGTICFIAEVSNCSCPTWYIHECINIDPQPVCGIITEDHVNLYPDPNGDPDLFYICPHNDAAIKIHPDHPFADCRIQWQFSFTTNPGDWENLGTGNTSQNTNVLPQLKPAGSPYLWPPLQEEIFYRIKCLPLSDPSGCEPCYSNVLTIKLLEPPDPPVITGTPDPICDGSSTPLAIEDYFAENTYEWFLNGFSVGFGVPFYASQGGLYVVSVTDQYGCHTVDSDPFYLQVCTVEAKICCPSPPCPCIGDPITLSAGASSSTCVGTLTYAWSWDSGVLIADNGSSIDHIPAPTGTTYTVIVTDAHGCIGTAVRTVVPCECEPQPFVCGDIFTDDRDGQEYKTAQIGNQCWMADNLSYLPNVFFSSNVSNTTPRYYVYGYEGTNVSDAKATDNYENYGVLYNWQASLIACPSGWHLPTNAEWTTLVNTIAGPTNQKANKLKSCRQVGTTNPSPGCNTEEHPRWNYHNTQYGTDDYNFSALPGGMHTDGSFGSLGVMSYFWTATSTEGYTYRAWSWSMSWQSGNISNQWSNYYRFGLSVRCVKD
jgi:uncharacterized protein (TIGR02145 family)